MAKLQAARQTSAGIVEAESRKAYPENADNRQLEIPLNSGQSDTLNPAPSHLQQEDPVTGIPSPNENEEITEKDTEALQQIKRTAEKISYTTISVPKEYGQKAKLYATLLRVNMVEFTCGALDTYILQLQERGKLPRVDL